MRAGKADQSRRAVGGVERDVVEVITDNEMRLRLRTRYPG